MNCSEVERLFDPYLDNELSGSLRLEFDAHRLRCPLCQQKLALMEACAHIITSDRRTPPLADNFTDTVMEAIAAKRISEKLALRRKRMVAATIVLNAAAAVAVIAFFWPSRQAGAPTVGSAELASIVADGDSPRLYDFIRRRVEQASLAQANLSNDVGSLRKFALNAANLADAGSFHSLFWLFGAEETDGGAEDTPADAAADSISL